MPTATDELREQMRRWFGDEIDPFGPSRFIQMRGYTIDHGGMIHPPTLSHTVRDEEWKCICFLVDEWDYGYTGKGK